MRLLILTFALAVLAVAQTLPAPTAPGSKCTYEVLPDGRVKLDCDPATTGKTDDGKDYRDKWIVLCRTKILNIDTIITVDVTTIELQLFDLEKLIAWAGAQPALSNPAYAPSYSAWNLPADWQSLSKFVVTRAEWEALPPAGRWAAVKQQPPSQFAKLPVSGACAAKILEKLRINAEEPY